MKATSLAIKNYIDVGRIPRSGIRRSVYQFSTIRSGIYIEAILSTNF